MENINERFFNAFFAREIHMKRVYTSNTPSEMVLSKDTNSDWFTWKPLKGTLTSEDYHKIERQFNIKFPPSFIDWHRSYFFLDCDLGIFRLPYSLPTQPLKEIIDDLSWDISKDLISFELIPFANEGNDVGFVIFDTRIQNDNGEYPIRVYDFDYSDILDGLSEIIFSSFSKLLECMTHLLKETETKHQFDIIPQFFEIDTLGAGASGRAYWEGFYR